MEYRIFGPGGSPPDDFRSDLQALLKLNDAQRATIADWFLVTKDYDMFRSGLPANIVASTLLPEQFRSAAVTLRSLLFAWQEYGLQLGDIERDLLLQGLSPKELAVIMPFLGRLSTIKQRVWAFDYARMKELYGLPSVDDLNLICEARAVFGGYARGDDYPGDSYKRFLGMIPMVIMEFATSDAYGNKQRVAFQLSEATFDGLRKAIEMAHEQMSILKERTAAVAFNGNELR